MSNPAMSNLPGFGAIAETMEMVRTMWGGASTPGLGIPGMVMPTLSVDEINKQISDLKAVESWLTLNMNMLRGTIQALEVQSATISTLRSMGESLSAAIKPAPVKSPESTYSFFRAPVQQAPEPAPVPQAAAPAARVEPVAEKPEPVEQAPAKKESAVRPASDTPFATPMADPAAWWNLLQDQFKQAVNTAMVPDQNSAATMPAAAKSAAKKTGAAVRKASAGTAVDAPAKGGAKPAVKRPAR